MTDPTSQPPPEQPPGHAPGQPPGQQGAPWPPTSPYAVPPGGPVGPYAGAPGPLVPYGPGPIGKQRSTGLCMLLFFVTLGIYGYVWIFLVHEEMKAHRHEGLGGGISLLLWFFLGTFAMGFLTPMEVARMYEARGERPPVTALTGLWATVGLLLCGVGPIVWFVQTNAALNRYWASLGAPRP